MTKSLFLRLPALALPLAVGAVHCSLTTSLDGFSSGGPRDDAAPPLDAAEVEVGATPGLDASVDGADANDTRRWCERLTPAAGFCDDFDDIASPQPWDVTRIDPGTTLARDTANARSAPRSLLVTSVVTEKGGVQLRRSLPGANVKRLHVGYDLEIDAFGDYAEIAYVRLDGPPGCSMLIRLRAADQDLGFTLQSYATDPATNYDMSAGPSAGLQTWKRIDFDMDLDAGVAKLRVEGTEVASIAIPASVCGPGPASAAVGLEYIPPDGKTWAVRFDNVTTDWQ